MTTTTDLQHNVNAGAELLDTAWPGWADEIDLPTLDLSHPNQCVLGQVRDTYASGLRELARKVGFDPGGFDWRYQYGYSLASDPVQTPQGSQVDGWELLTVLWSAKIEERRA